MRLWAWPSKCNASKSFPYRSNTTTVKQPYSNASRPAELPTPLPIKRLTPDEMATRKAKGLCYNCDERFVPGDRCNPAQFQCLLAESVDATVDNPTPQDGVEPTTETTLTPQISFHALTGQLVPSTLKLSGTLNGHSVIILVDGGSTNNFIQTRLAHHLGRLITFEGYGWKRGHSDVSTSATSVWYNLFPGKSVAFTHLWC